MSYRFSDQIDPADFESEHIFEFLTAKTLVSGNFMYRVSVLKYHLSKIKNVISQLLVDVQVPDSRRLLISVVLQVVKVTAL